MGAGAGGNTGWTIGGINDLTNPNSFSMRGCATPSPSSGLTCCGGLSSPFSLTMLSDETLRFSDPEDANEFSRVMGDPRSSFC